MQIGYRTNTVDDGKTWNFAVHATYRFAATIGARIRFDSIHHAAAAGQGFSVNMISLSLTKTFE
jgi:hypothetical protein